jgi:hypothetical protein
MSPVGFEPIISACERPQTHGLDRGATVKEKKYTILLIRIPVFCEQAPVYICRQVSKFRKEPQPVSSGQVREQTG